MRRSLLLLAIVLTAAANFAAQDEPSFDVVSIKPNRQDSNRSNLDLQPGGRLVATNTSLLQMITIAYGEGGLPLQGNRLAPLKEKWIGGTFGGGFTTADRFDIIAKADHDLTRDQVPAALRKLLADRFKLIVHHESKERPVYHLMLARADERLGPKLRRSDVDCTDVTGLAGTFEFDIE